MKKQMDTLAEKDLKYIWHPCSQMKDYEELPAIIIDRAKGVHLYDIHGKSYIDIVSSWWCNLLGHCNPTINHAMHQQLDRLEHVIFANFSHTPAIELCDRLSSLLPKGLCKFNFSDNGSAAIECALKMSFQYHYQTGQPQRTRFMALTDGYHGETIGALSVSGADLYTDIYKPILTDVVHVQAPDCYRCPYGQQRENCTAPCFEHVVEAMEQVGSHTCGFIVEPLLQGAAGMRIYPPIYLQKLRAACDAHGVLLIADEIATGYGRTGKMFACDHAGITPDIICLSKGLTGGYMPMALTITTQNIYDAFYADYQEGKAFMHSHTYSGNPLACSAAIAVLDILEDGTVFAQAEENAAFLHCILQEQLGQHKNVGEIRQIGLINAIELVQDKTAKTPFPSTSRTGYQIYKKALQCGLLLRPLGDVLYFNPPLTITQEELKEAVSLCRSAILEILPNN